MKPKIRTPFFETSVKNYIYGDAVLEMAVAADRAAVKYDVDVLFISPYTEIRRIRENCPHLIILAPYMDTIRPGRGMADVLPEALKAAGAQGVVVNHCERPMTLTAIKKTIDRANELDMLSFACADTIARRRPSPQLHPDISTGAHRTDRYRHGQRHVLRQGSHPRGQGHRPEHSRRTGGGHHTAQQIYDFIMAGSEAAGSASGIIKSPNPLELLDEMVKYVRKAKDDLANMR